MNEKIVSENSADGQRPPRGGRRMWKSLARVARCKGVTLREADTRHFYLSLRLASAVDELVDEFHHEDVTAEVKGVFDGQPFGNIDGLTQSEASEMAHRFKDYPEERKTAVLKIADLALYAQERVRARSAAELIDVNIREADVLADAVALDVSGHDKKERLKFNDWLTSISRTAYLYDTTCDLREDKKSGIISIDPSISNRMVIGRATVSEGINMLGLTPALQVPQLARVAVLTLTENSVY